MKQYYSKTKHLLLITTIAIFLTQIAIAQDLEPRRWSHLPANINFAGAGYAFTQANIYFDPVLEIENVTLDMHSAVATYIRTANLFGHSARIDLTALYQDAKWSGLLQGEPASATRSGFDDPTIRLSMNLIGGKPLKGAEFAKYKAAHRIETIVGAGLTVKLPLGEYYSDKLLNLGENRFVFRPELGVIHTHNKWSAELTGSARIYTDNNDFWNGNQRAQDPIYVLQSHFVYTFQPGLWLSGGAGYGYGGQSHINDVIKDDRQSKFGCGVSFGYPINRSVGIKAAYFNRQTRESTGLDSDTFVTAISVLW